MHKRLVKIGLVGLVLVGQLSTAQSDPCSTDVLPPVLRQELEQKWSKWSILTLGELRREDAALWTRRMKDRCPGYTFGAFVPGEARGYSITLVRVVNGRKRQLLVVAYRVGDKFRIDTLDGPRSVPYYSVVRTLPPGTYKDSGHPTHVETDLVGYEALEAGMIAFAYQDGRWRRFQIAE